MVFVGKGALCALMVIACGSLWAQLPSEQKWAIETIKRYPDSGLHLPASPCQVTSWQIATVCLVDYLAFNKEADSLDQEILSLSEEVNGFSGKEPSKEELNLLRQRVAQLKTWVGEMKFYAKSPLLEIAQKHQSELVQMGVRYPKMMSDLRELQLRRTCVDYEPVKVKRKRKRHYR